MQCLHQKVSHQSLPFLFLLQQMRPTSRSRSTGSSRTDPKLTARVVGFFKNMFFCFFKTVRPVLTIDTDCGVSGMRLEKLTCDETALALWHILRGCLLEK